MSNGMAIDNAINTENVLSNACVRCACVLSSPEPRIRWQKIVLTRRNEISMKSDMSAQHITIEATKENLEAICLYGLRMAIFFYDTFPLDTKHDGEFIFICLIRHCRSEGGCRRVRCAYVCCALVSRWLALLGRACNVICAHWLHLVDLGRIQPTSRFDFGNQSINEWKKKWTNKIEIKIIAFCSNLDFILTKDFISWWWCS